MRLFSIALALLALLANPLFAACDGQSLLGSLTPEEQQEFDRRIKDAPFAEGNHWRATRGDQVLHLIGTMHLGDPRLDAPTERLAPLIKGADLLLLELAAPEKEALDESLKTRTDLLLLTDTSLPELLSEQDWQALAQAMRARNMPPFMGAKMQPWFIAMLLSIPACLQDQMIDQNGLDNRLEVAALAAGVPSASLEHFETGFRVFSDMPFETQILLVRAALGGPDVSEDLFETVLSGYFSERHVASQIALEVLSPRLTPLTPEEDATLFAAVNQTLLVARNRAWIPVIEEALDDSDGYVVAAFGAAHLGGQDGVLNLLAQRGFTLKRLPF